MYSLLCTAQTSKCQKSSSFLQVFQVFSVFHLKNQNRETQCSICLYVSLDLDEISSECYVLLKKLPKYFTELQRIIRYPKNWRKIAPKKSDDTYPRTPGHKYRSEDIKFRDPLMRDRKGGKKSSEKTRDQKVQSMIPVPKRASSWMWQKRRKNAVPKVVMACVGTLLLLQK